jgi:hypothetical protein
MSTFITRIYVYVRQVVSHILHIEEEEEEEGKKNKNEFVDRFSQRSCLTIIDRE